MKPMLVVLMVVFVVHVLAMSSPAQAPRSSRRAVPPKQVKIEDKFWAPRLDINRTRTLPHNLDMCEQTGRIANFARAAGKLDGKYEGRFYNDSDVYKVLEGAAYVLAMHPDKQLQARIDAIIDTIAAAQQPDGYLNAYYTVMEPDKRWTNLEHMHELYCAGHMFEAAVAYADATGNTKLLDVARRMADHVDSVFGPDGRKGVPGHEEIELALIKLYRKTGEPRYRELAEFFIDARGHSTSDRAQYCQDHAPIAEQKEIVGHAVRAMYLYCGVADVAALTGNPAYYQALERIWQDVTMRKMYITGGVGARHEGEAFGGAYELPNDSAYAETCAGIGLALWAERLMLLLPQGRFADVLERVFYNHLLASVSLKGDTFFYVNPLASTGKHHRKPWYGTACCPTNVVRVVPQVAGFMYAQNDNTIWVNLYVGSTAKVSLAAGDVTLKQETDYPWDGKVRIVVTPAKEAELGIALRLPGWCDAPAVRVNGADAGGRSRPGTYQRITRTWRAGDVIELDLPMPIRRIQAHPEVAADRGRIALQRGPVVYCLEAVDNGGTALNLALPRTAELRAEWKPDLLGGVTVIKGRGVAVEPLEWANKLYQPVAATREVDLAAVPYCVWDNREPGEMTVWIPESPAVAGAVD